MNALTTVLMTATGIGASGLGCAAVAAAMSTAADSNPGEDRFRGDTGATRVISTAFAVTGSGAMVALSCAGTASFQTQAVLAAMALMGAGAWLVCGGRNGYDMHARSWCVGIDRQCHPFRRGQEAVTWDDGTGICLGCARAAIGSLDSEDVTR